MSAIIPLVLWTDKESNQPRPDPNLSLSLPPTTAKDRATRLAAMIIAWNTFQHFYSYFDVVGTDWSLVLPDSLKRAAVDRDEHAFLATLKLLSAKLRDGHARASMRQKRNRSSPQSLGNG